VLQISDVCRENMRISSSKNFLLPYHILRFFKICLVMASCLTSIFYFVPPFAAFQYYMLPIFVIGSRYGASCCLGDVVVSVLATGLNDRWFNPGRGDGFLRAIKIRSTPSFRWEINPEFPCRKILRHVKDLLRYFRC
jgi:hypothetical protein